MKKNKLYKLVLIACFIGYSWLFFFNSFANSTSKIDFTACIFKRITTIPCPSCGTTRAVEELFQGHFLSSVLLNPFGIVVALIMLVCPLWITFDYLAKKQSFYNFYTKTESVIRIPRIALFLVILVLLNWIWNIQKQL